jgi:hypothetical protein
MRLVPWRKVSKGHRWRERGPEVGQRGFGRIHAGNSGSLFLLLLPFDNLLGLAGKSERVEGIDGKER